jgi:predicted esterase
VSQRSLSILLLHGRHSAPVGPKPTFLRRHGHDVHNPALDDYDFEAAVRTAQAEYDAHRPDVIVGSSRGGAMAVNLASGGTPIVLLCPGWKRWGAATTTMPNTVILHARADDLVPFAHSEELAANSGLPAGAVVEVGDDHWLADAGSLGAMLEACDRLGRR